MSEIEKTDKNSPKIGITYKDLEVELLAFYNQKALM